MLLRTTAALALLAATPPCSPSGDSTTTSLSPGGGSEEVEPLTEEEIACQIVDTLGCGDSATVDTSEFVNNITDYGPWVGNWSGPEVGFRLTATGTVTVRIATPRPSETNFDLFLMQRNGSSCEPSDTIGYHWNSLQIEGATGDLTVYVDGVSGVSGEVTLEVTCEGSTPGGGSTTGGGTTGGGTTGGGTTGGGTTGGGTTGGGTTGGGGDTVDTPGAGGGDPSGTSVCYPGEYDIWTSCVPTVPASSVTDPDYNYGAASASPSAAWYQPPTRFADLTAISAGLKVSPSFAVHEFMARWKGDYGVFDPQVVVKMQQIRDAVGGPLTINSGYRSPDYNSGVGGATWSRHMYGDAVDFRSSAASLSTLRSHCTSRGAGFTKLYANHIHCDWRSTAQPSGYFGGGARDEMTEFTQDLFDEGEDSWFEEVPTAASVGQAVEMALDWVGFPEGDPYVEWGVQSPDGTMLRTGEGTVVDFVPRAPGQYRVQAEVGGIVLVTETVTVQ